MCRLSGANVWPKWSKLDQNSNLSFVTENTTKGADVEIFPMVSWANFKVESDEDPDRASAIYVQGKVISWMWSIALPNQSQQDILTYIDRG